MDKTPIQVLSDQIMIYENAKVVCLSKYLDDEITLKRQIEITCDLSKNVDEFQSAIKKLSKESESEAQVCSCEIPRFDLGNDKWCIACRKPIKWE